MPLVVIISLLIVVAIWLLRLHLRNTRRNKLLKLPLDPSWVDILNENVSIYPKLPKSLQEELHGYINVFLDEKEFFGFEGIEINDEIRLTVAGNACLLLLQGNKHHFPDFTSILIYPDTYVAYETQNDGLLTTQHASQRAGESWVRGPIVLSWASVKHGSENPDDGHNVVIHEFAHKLDEQTGHMNGLPLLRDKAHYKAWNKVLSEEFEALHERASKGKNKVLDEYGTVSPAEFFAVASESFFEKPVQMKKRLPDLYKQLQTFYNIDPASWN